MRCPLRATTKDVESGSRNTDAEQGLTAAGGSGNTANDLVPYSLTHTYADRALVKARSAVQNLSLQRMR